MSDRTTLQTNSEVLELLDEIKNKTGINKKRLIADMVKAKHAEVINHE